jgi:MFS transporter, ACS family, allantoate permease
MGLPITGQNYNLVSLAFYVGKWASEHSKLIYEQSYRVFGLGISNDVYLSKDSNCKVLGLVSSSCRGEVVTFLIPGIGGNVVLWGALLMLHAAAPTFSSFFALRFLLGILDDGVFYEFNSLIRVQGCAKAVSRLSLFY